VSLPLLSAALIVRDEEAVLGACLGSLRGLVDEIVVVDTGSTDRSPSIAVDHGARVVHHRWTDDFAEARNVSLDHATGRWVLYIDADERIVDCDHDAVRRRLNRASEAAFRVWLRPERDSTPYREYRLWRHDPRIRFEGVIHERVTTAIHRVAEQDGRDIGLLDVLIDHVGYEGDQIAKHRRNLPLLRRQLDADRSNLFVWHHLSRVLDGLGHQAEAERVLDEGVQVARDLPYVDPCGVMLFADLVTRRRERGVDASRLLAEARATYPTNCVLLYLEGQALTDAGEHDLAVERFDALLSTDVDGLPPGSPSYDERLFGDLAHAGRALALFRSGRYAEAARSYAAAAELVPSNAEYTVKQQLAEARARSSTVHATGRSPWS
jgi:hypothetical protein